MECNSVQRNSGVNFQAIKKIKINEHLKNNYPEKAKEILDLLEKNKTLQKFTKDYDVSIEVGSKTLLGIIHKFMLKLKVLDVTNYIKTSSPYDRHMDVINDVLAKMNFTIKKNFYESGTDPLGLKIFLDEPQLKYLKYHKPREGVGKDDLGGHSGYWDTKEIGKNIKKSLLKLDNKIFNIVDKRIKTKEHIKKLKRLEKLAIEAKKQRVENIPNTIKEVDEQINRMIK